MGGIACIIVEHALVRYESVPSHKNAQKELEGQLRQCYANPLIAVATEEHGTGVAVYEVLEKQNLTPEDLDFLLHALPSYSSA